MSCINELSPDEARPYIVDMLDAIRKEEQAVALNKSRYIVFARRHHFTFAEIAELLHMSEQGVGKAFKRIARSMPEWVI